MRSLCARKSLSILFLAASLGVITPAHADTPVSWADPSSSGNWSDPTQWNPQVSPNGDYDVTLPAGHEIVALDISPTIDSFAVGSGTTFQTNSATSLTTGSLNSSGDVFFISGSLISVTEDMTNSGTMSVGAGTTLSVGGNLTNNGDLGTGYGGGGNTINVSGTCINSGTLELTRDGDTANLNALNNQGSVTIDGGTSLNITGGGAGITDVATGSSYFVAGNFNVINGVATTSAVANLASVEGQLFLVSGQSYNMGALTNSGSFSVGSGTALSIAGNLTNNGDLGTGYGGGGNIINVSGTLINSKTFELTRDGDVASLAALNNSGTVTVDSDTLLRIGSGVFSATSGYQQVANGVFDEVISSTGTYGIGNISGPIALDGTLDVTFANGFVPSLGESFIFLNGTVAELSGQYASINAPPIAGGEWQIIYNDAAGTVTLMAVAPEPALLSLLALALPAMPNRRRFRA